MAKTLISPSRYVQGPGEFKNIGNYASKYGKKALAIISKGGYKREGSTVEDSFKKEGIDVGFDFFNGECSKNEIKRIENIVKDEGYDVIIGIGGGNNAPVSGNMISFSFDMSGSSFVLQSEEGEVIAAYNLETERTQNNVVVMSEKLEKGKTYTVVVDAGIESDGVFNGLSLGDTSVSGGTVTYSEVASSIASGYHYSMGGGMKGGGMPFGQGGERPERPFGNK